MGKAEIVTVIIIGAAIFATFCVSIVLFVLYYMKSKKLHLQQLQNEILKAEIDSIEKTSVKLSRELHDNVAQHLSLACILLQEDAVTQKQISTIHKLVDGSIDELRNISRSLTAHHFENTDLSHAIEQEIGIYDQLANIKINFYCELNQIPVSKEKQLMLLRICQETLNNAVKHSSAKNISISLKKEKDDYCLKISDDGSGFEPDSKIEGSNGLQNIQQRADYINANLLIKSAPQKGTEISVFFR